MHTCRDRQYAHDKCTRAETDSRAVYFSELELAEIYGSGQKTGKQHLQVFCPEPCISASSSLQKYTVRVKKPENKIFKLFDPGRVFQRARACINIRFGSKTGEQNLQVFCPEPCISASSSLQNYTVRVKKPENNIVNFLTRH